MTTNRAERVTISDIARRLAISKASVSYALNGRPGVSSETRRKVLELADELGFQASSAAVALSASRSGTIGLVIARDPSVITAEGYYMRTLFGVEQYLNDADGSLLLRLTGEGGEDLDVYRRWARQRRVDGFLLFDEFDDDPRLPLLTSLGMPGRPRHVTADRRRHSADWSRPRSRRSPSSSTTCVRSATNASATSAGR